MHAAAGAMAVGLAASVWLHYLWLIPRELVPAKPIVHRAAAWLALALCGGALALTPTPLGAALALSGGGLAAFFLWLLTQAPLPDGAITVAVGEAMPSLTLLDDTGAHRALSDWHGRRVLLKLFRGHW